MPFHLTLPAAVALIGFVAVSVLIGSAMAAAGGWRALAGRYPAPITPPAREERHRFTSMRTAGGAIGVARYESCVTVGISPLGISLALWAPFRLFHPSLLLPWDAVETWRAFEVYGRHWTEIIVRGGGKVTVYGRAAQAISRWATQRGIPEGAAVGASQ